MFYAIDKIDNRLLKIVPFVIIGAIAEVLNFDYGMYGIIAAFIMYMFGSSNRDRAIGTAIGFLFEITYLTPLISAVLIYFYNHERGRQPKYFFYVFYPLHLLLIYFLRFSILGY